MAAKPSAEALREMRLRRFGVPSSSSGGSAESSSPSSSTRFGNGKGKDKSSSFETLPILTPGPQSEQQDRPSSDRERELELFRNQWTKEVHKRKTAQQRAMEADSEEAQEKRKTREEKRRREVERDRRPTMQELEELALREAEERISLQLRIKKLENERREHYRRTWLPELDQQLSKWTSEWIPKKYPLGSEATPPLEIIRNTTGRYQATHKALAINELLEGILSYFPSIELLMLQAVDHQWQSVASRLISKKGGVPSWIDPVEPIDLYGVIDPSVIPGFERYHCCADWTGKCDSCRHDPDQNNLGRHLRKICQLKPNPYLERRILGFGRLLIHQSSEAEVKLVRGLEPHFIYSLEPRFTNVDALWRKMYLMKPPPRRIALYHAYGPTIKEIRNLIDVVYDPDGIRCGQFLDTLERYAAEIVQRWMKAKREEKAREEAFIETAEFQKLKLCKSFLGEEPRFLIKLTDMHPSSVSGRRPTAV